MFRPDLKAALEEVFGVEEPLEAHLVPDIISDREEARSAAFGSSCGVIATAPFTVEATGGGRGYVGVYSAKGLLYSQACPHLLRPGDSVTVSELVNIRLI